MTRRLFSLIVLLAMLLPVAAHAKVYNNVQGHSFTLGPGDAGVSFDCLTGDSNCTDTKSIPPQQNGTWAYCHDCNQAGLCTAGGGGAVAQYVSGIWQCSGGGPVPLFSGTANSLTGVGGSPFISGFDINNIKNPGAHGVISGSTNTGTGSINAASTSLALSATGDWVNGEGIAVPGAGPTPGLSTPSAPSAAATCSGTCVTAYTYKVAGVDLLGRATAASTASGSVNNAATLDEAHFNLVTLTMQNQPVKTWLLYRNGTLVAKLPVSEVSNSNKVQYFRDTGVSTTESGPCIAASAPSSVCAGPLYSTIVSGAGTLNLTLANAATTQATSVTVYHDDEAAIQAAVATLTATSGGVIDLPPAKFVTQQPILIGSIGGGINQPVLRSSGSHPATIKAGVLMDGLPVIVSENNWQPQFTNLTIEGTSGGLPSACIDFDINNPSLVNIGGNYAGEGMVDKVDCSTNGPTMGVAFTAAYGYDENNSENSITNFDVNASQFGVWIGHENSLQNRIILGNISGTEGAIATQGGSFSLYGTVASSSQHLIDLEKGVIAHDIEIHGLHAEASAGLLRVDAGAATGNYQISFFGPDLAVLTGNATTTDMVLFNNATMSLGLYGVHLGEGASNNNWVDNALSTALVGNRLAITGISGSTNVYAIDNSWPSASPSSTISGTWYGLNNSNQNGAFTNDYTNAERLFSLLINSTLSAGSDNFSIGQPANSDDTIDCFRATDSAPTGNCLRGLNAAANAETFHIDVNGNGFFGGALSAGTGPTTITNASGTLKATALDNGAWAIPGAIGGTTPNTVNSSGGTLNGSLGATTPSTVKGTTIFASLGVGATPAALSTFGTCNSGTEGLSGTQTNSTAACTAGTTATSAGTTHCQIYCNGSNWVQTGR